MQAGRPALIQKDGGEMLIAIVLDRPLAEAKALVDDPAAFTQAMTAILLRRPCGVVGRATFLTSRTDYRWRFDSPLVRR